LNLHFEEYFNCFSKPTADNLFLIVLAAITLESFRSIRFLYEHFISRISTKSLNAFYYACSYANVDFSKFASVTVSLMLKLIPQTLEIQPIFLVIDDTLVEKFGVKFQDCSKLFDHAAHNGSNYLNGHCFVSLLLCVPIVWKGRSQYICVPLSYRLWTKETSKLKLAAGMVESVMPLLESRSVILLCDSWYPKGNITSLVDDFKNLDLICNTH